MKTLVIIPARGGSKGVPGKNIKPLMGKPLIQYTIEAARKIFPDEQICVSTDSQEIKACAESIGLKVPFIRPSELSTDTAGTYEVLLHALNYYEKKGVSIDTLVLLQATSPFRTTAQIEEAVQLFSGDIDMVVSVKETKSNPYYNLFEENEEGYLKKSKPGNFTRRQDCPKVWEYNGAIYVIKVDVLKMKPLHRFSRIKKYPMNDFTSIDIDTTFDWHLAELAISGSSTENI